MPEYNTASVRDAYSISYFRISVWILGCDFQIALLLVSSRLLSISTFFLPSSS